MNPDGMQPRKTDHDHRFLKMTWRRMAGCSFTFLLPHLLYCCCMSFLPWNVGPWRREGGLKKGEACCPYTWFRSCCRVSPEVRAAEQASAWARDVPPLFLRTLCSPAHTVSAGGYLVAPSLGLGNRRRKDKAFSPHTCTIDDLRDSVLPAHAVSLLYGLGCGGEEQGARCAS